MIPSVAPEASDCYWDCRDGQLRIDWAEKLLPVTLINSGKIYWVSPFVLFMDSFLPVINPSNIFPIILNFWG